MFGAFLELPESVATPASFASVRLAVSGAAELPLHRAEAFLERFGITIYEGYGLTEAAPIVSTTAVEDAPRWGSIGPPVPGVEVRLVGEDGEDAVAGDPGEIWVRGQNVFLGYWDDPAATELVLVDGWLRTGDVAVADDDGYLSLVDRKKDLVIVSGFNVFPAEVEDVLLAQPGIADAAVIGVPNPRTGESVAAWVVLEPGATVAVDQVREFAAAHLARLQGAVHRRDRRGAPAQRSRQAAAARAPNPQLRAGSAVGLPTVAGLRLVALAPAATRKPT